MASCAFCSLSSLPLWAIRGTVTSRMPMHAIPSFMISLLSCRSIGDECTEKPRVLYFVEVARAGDHLAAQPERPGGACGDRERFAMGECEVDIGVAPQSAGDLVLRGVDAVVR